jgi:hypothetical protein
MTPRTCIHEADVVAAVLSRRWPGACDDSLRAHAEACDVCREVVAVAARLKDDYDAARETIARRDVPLPSAGQIWWRAAIHARADAARAANRPLVWGYGVAAACAVGLFIAAVSLLWPSVSPVFDRVASLAGGVPPVAATATATILETLKARLPLVITVAAFLIAAPVALYFALREE